MRALRSALLWALLVAASCATEKAAVPSTAANASAPASNATEPQAKALLYEVTRPGAPDRPLYLTGSIHLGRPDSFPFPPSMEAAFARSTALVVELDPAGQGAQRTQQLVFQLGVAKSPEQLLSKSLDAETLRLLPAALQRVGLQAQAVEPMRPWLLAVTLSVLELQKAGFSEKDGLDNLLLGRSRGQKKIVELETMEAQLHALADLSPEVQALMVREAIRQGAETPTMLSGIATAWQRGDAAAINAFVYESAADPRFAPLYERLFLARNRSMAKSLAALVDQPGTHFAVVGVGHVVGPEGIAALLATQGFSVRQLPRDTLR